MKKILLSTLILAAASGAAILGSNAFFSDTESSVDNVFAAGAIDLQIDNTSYAIDWNIPGYDTPTGEFVESNHTTWALTDLTVEKFFDFEDLKPGDYGEDTISVHAQNDAWVCAAARLTDDNDGTYAEPELEDDSTVGADPATTDGELDGEVNFAFWVDDGDNVYENDEQIFLDGPLSNLNNAGRITIADSNGSVVGLTGAVPAESTFYIGKFWCFGDMNAAPITQDGVNTGTPLTLGTGFTCDGASVDNAAQTDVVVGDLQFYAEQARNNDTFSCDSWSPDWPTAAQPIGAALGAYTAPDDCTVTVSSDVQVAIDAATSGDTVCVDDGTYNETLVINKPLTLASTTGATNSATITGGIQIDSNDVTVTGFIINPGDVPADPGNIGVFINGSYSNIEISYNDIDGSSVGSDIGVLTTTGATLSNIDIMHNEIHDLVSGIYLNPHTGMVDVMYNDIDNNTAGIGGLNGANVMYNEFEHTAPGSEAIGLDSSWDSNGGSVMNNNFLDDTRLNTYTTITATIDAENNYWSPNGAAAQVDDSNGPVDFSPEAAVMFPHN